MLASQHSSLQKSSEPSSNGKPKTGPLATGSKCFAGNAWQKLQILVAILLFLGQSKGWPKIKPLYYRAQEPSPLRLRLEIPTSCYCTCLQWSWLWVPLRFPCACFVLCIASQGSPQPGDNQ